MNFSKHAGQLYETSCEVGCPSLHASFCLEDEFQAAKEGKKTVGKSLSFIQAESSEIRSPFVLGLSSATSQLQGTVTSCNGATATRTREKHASDSSAGGKLG